MGFTCISVSHLPTWVDVLKNSDGIINTTDMHKELCLIEDLLTLQKTFSLLNTKKGLKTMLEARIAHELGYKSRDLNSKRGRAWYLPANTRLFL